MVIKKHRPEALAKVRQVDLVHGSPLTRAAAQAAKASRLVYNCVPDRIPTAFCDKTT